MPTLTPPLVNPDGLACSLRARSVVVCCCLGYSKIERTVEHDKGEFHQFKLMNLIEHLLASIRINCSFFLSEQLVHLGGAVEAIV